MFSGKAVLPRFSDFSECQYFSIFNDILIGDLYVYFIICFPYFTKCHSAPAVMICGKLNIQVSHHLGRIIGLWKVCGVVVVGHMMAYGSVSQGTVYTLFYYNYNYIIIQPCKLKHYLYEKVQF
jgi:hypothetical protein